jgi:hypothetical protein
MKLINYKRGYNNTFDCSIHGTIKMSRDEYDEMVMFLYKNENKVWNKDILYTDLANRIHFKGGFLCNIRTTTTEMVAKHFGLTNYKPNNYQIEVTDF